MDTVESASLTFDYCFAKLAVYKALEQEKHTQLLAEFNDISIYCTGWKPFDDIVIKISESKNQDSLTRQLKKRLDQLKIDMWNNLFESFSDFAVKSTGSILMKSMQYAVSTQKESLLDQTAKISKQFIALCNATQRDKGLISCLVDILQNEFVYHIAHDEYEAAMREIGKRLTVYEDTLTGR